MKKLAKIENEELHTVSVALGDDTEFYESMGFTEMSVEHGYDGNWYIEGYAPEKPEPTIQEQIEALELQITKRNLRAALLGDEFALNKIQEIESQIEELRKKLL